MKFIPETTHPLCPGVGVRPENNQKNKHNAAKRLGANKKEAAKEGGTQKREKVKGGRKQGRRNTEQGGKGGTQSREGGGRVKKAGNQEKEEKHGSMASSPQAPSAALATSSS